MGNTASACETTTVPLHLRKYLHGLCFIGIWHVYLNMYAQYIPTENLEISTSSQKLPVQQKLFPEQKLPGCTEGTCTVAKCHRCGRRYICVKILDSFTKGTWLRRTHWDVKDIKGLICVELPILFDLIAWVPKRTIRWIEPEVPEYWAWVFLFTIVFVFLSYLLWAGLCPGSKSIGRLVSNKTSERNIEIGFSISFVSAAERGHKILIPLWCGERNRENLTPAHPLLKRAVRHKGVRVAKTLKQNKNRKAEIYSFK